MSRAHLRPTLLVCLLLLFFRLSFSGMVARCLPLCVRSCVVLLVALLLSNCLIPDMRKERRSFIIRTLFFYYLSFFFFGFYTWRRKRKKKKGERRRRRRKKETLDNVGFFFSSCHLSPRFFPQQMLLGVSVLLSLLERCEKKKVEVLRGCRSERSVTPLSRKTHGYVLG